MNQSVCASFKKGLFYLEWPSKPTGAIVENIITHS
jgi:hypothetical protein